MSELLPCPLCGGPAYDEATIMHATVRCRSCRLSLSEMRGPMDSHEDIAMPLARKRWNTRHAAPVVISEGSVRRALAAFYGKDWMARFDEAGIASTEEDMRAALEAASLPLPLPPKDKK